MEAETRKFNRSFLHLFIMCNHLQNKYTINLGVQQCFECDFD